MNFKKVFQETTVDTNEPQKEGLTTKNVYCATNTFGLGSAPFGLCRRLFNACIKQVC